jgi:hypothetical protein
MGTDISRQSSVVGDRRRASFVGGRWSAVGHQALFVKKIAITRTVPSIAMTSNNGDGSVKGTDIIRERRSEAGGQKLISHL